MNTTVDLLQIKINKAKEELPKETVEAIDAVDWKSIIIKMREEKGYSFEQLENLEIETELLLCGLTNTENYPKELETRMNLPKAQIDELVNEMNEKVFIKIREELIKRIEKNKKTIEPEENIEIESREEMLRHIENPPAHNALSYADAGGEPVKSITNFELEITDGKKKEVQPESHIDTISEKKPKNELKKEDSNSILIQKLSKSFKIPTVETDHSLENITKGSNTVSEKTKLPHIDPYRELPE